MKKILKKVSSLILLAMLFVLVFSTAIYAAEGNKVVVQIPVEMKSSGYVPSTEEDLNLVLTAKDVTAPMPDGSVDGVYKLVVNGDGIKHFPKVEFLKVGVYKYSISQEKGTNSRGIYDETVYDVEVYITNKETGDGLDSVVLGYIKNNGKKQSIEFNNSYSRPSSGDKDPDPKPTPKTPEPPMETEVISDGDVPLASGVLGLLDELPKGLLPATGDETPIFLYIGLLMIGILGLIGLAVEFRLGKKNRH